MASLFTKVKLYIEANSASWDDTKVSLQNDGSGDYIKTWTYSFSKPTDSQIASAIYFIIITSISSYYST